MKMPRDAILRLAEGIGYDLYQAITFYEVFAPSELNTDLKERVTSSAAHMGFSVISEALRLGVIVTLCRLWDKQGSSVRIVALLNKLRKNPTLVEDQDALKRWQAKVEKVEKSEVVKALRRFRNVGLAHRQNPADAPDPRIEHGTRLVVSGHERWLLEQTISIIHEFNTLLNYNRHIDFNCRRKAWERRATAFWEAVASASAMPKETG